MKKSATTATVTAKPEMGTVTEEFSKGMGAAQAGDRDAAYRIFQSLATRNVDAAEVWVWLGGTSPNLDEAESAFQRAVLLDPTNEEANLGLRWVALRRQIMGAVSGADTTASDTGVFTTGRSERSTSFDLNTGGFESARVSATTGPLGTGFLTAAGIGTGPLSLNNASNTNGLGTGTLTGPLKASDADSSLKIKVDGKAGRRRRIPIGAIILIIIALGLYAFAAYMFFVK